MIRPLAHTDFILYNIPQEGQITDQTDVFLANEDLLSNIQRVG
jgi:hypothetical protein